MSDPAPSFDHVMVVLARSRRRQARAVGAVNRIEIGEGELRGFVTTCDPRNRAAAHADDGARDAMTRVAEGTADDVVLDELTSNAAPKRSMT